MSFIKYRLRDVAADFGTNAKEISEIIGKHGEKPKSNAQVLTEDELNVVFDCMTKKYPAESMEQIQNMKAPGKAQQAEPAKQPEKVEKAEKPQTQNAPAPRAEGRQGNPAPRQNPQGQRNDNRDNRDNRPAQNRNAQNAQQAPKAPENKSAVKQPEPERKRERRVVDTSAVQVNTNRFDDVDNLISERAQNFQGGKQRIGGGKGAKQQKQQMGNKKGNKSRNEEQEKMRRLQMEVARKAPTVVKIPDEITVGELASRMKKTAAEVI